MKSLTINLKSFSIFFRVLIDFDIFNKTFMNKIFAQKLNFELIFFEIF